MELTVKVRLDSMPTARMAANIADRMSEYKAQVLLRRGDITVNAKSLIGIVSLGLREGMDCTIIASGGDEAQAAAAMAELLRR